MTHTYVILEVSKTTYTEIATKLKESGYDHVFHKGEGDHGEEMIDMNGIALQIEEESDEPSWKLLGLLKFDPSKYPGKFFSHEEFQRLLPLMPMSQNEIWMTDEYLARPFVRKKSLSVTTKEEEQYPLDISGMIGPLQNATAEAVFYLNDRGVTGDVIFAYVKWQYQTIWQIECVAFINKKSAIRSTR